MKQMVLNNIMSMQMRFFEAFFTWKTNDLVSDWDSKLRKLASDIQKFAPGVALVCIVAVGFLFVSGRKGADTGKTWLMYIVAGLAIIFSALSIYNWVTDGLPSGSL